MKTSLVREKKASSYTRPFTIVGYAIFHFHLDDLSQPDEKDLPHTLNTST